MSFKDSISAEDQALGGLAARHSTKDSLDPKGVFKVICRAADGSVRWKDDFANLVVTVGKNDLLDQYFRGSGYTATFFVGLKTAGSISINDTMSSKSWTEITAYSNATRPAYTTAAPSGGIITNSASPAIFNINGSAAAGGCFITTNSTKGGTTGTLFSAVDFSVVRNVLSGDTLSVVYQLAC